MVHDYLNLRVTILVHKLATEHFKGSAISDSDRMNGKLWDSDFRPNKKKLWGLNTVIALTPSKGVGMIKECDCVACSCSSLVSLGSGPLGSIFLKIVVFILFMSFIFGLPKTDKLGRTVILVSG